MFLILLAELTLSGHKSKTQRHKGIFCRFFSQTPGNAIVTGDNCCTNMTSNLSRILKILVKYEKKTKDK